MSIRPGGGLAPVPPNTDWWQVWAAPTLTALGNLRDECCRAMDAAQVGQPLPDGLYLAMQTVWATRSEPPEPDTPGLRPPAA